MVRSGVASSLAVLAGLAMLTPAQAVNRCTAPDGTTVFSDKACPPPPGLARLDPVPTGKAPKGNGQLTDEERAAIVRQMNAEVSAAIVRQAKQEAEADRMRARQREEEAARPKPVTIGEEMGFEQCRAVVARALLSVAGKARTIRIMDNEAATMHRICLSDGSLMLSCTAADRRFVRTTSPPDGRGC